MSLPRLVGHATFSAINVSTPFHARCSSARALEFARGAPFHVRYHPDSSSNMAFSQLINRSMKLVLVIDAIVYTVAHHLSYLQNPPCRSTFTSMDWSKRLKCIERRDSHRQSIHGTTFCETWISIICPPSFCLVRQSDPFGLQLACWRMTLRHFLQNVRQQGTLRAILITN